ncbi:MAG TPA: Trm112 family protein [Terracidiphilus sp.]|nr:Trm112 family protein [Terracidiphilus sp.]
MSETPGPGWEVDAGVLVLLACPACHGELRLEAARLRCMQCGRVYPIVDGIPSLIAEAGSGL